MVKEDLSQKPCKCGGTMVQIINAEKNIRVGWWCTADGCSNFTKAIGRERLVLRLV